MVVLGRKHKFTELEITKLSRKFAGFQVIRYTDKSSDQVLAELSAVLASQKVKLIVLNTKATVSNEIISYLTNLQFTQDIHFLTIEQFMERYLHKCYIPSDHTDLNFLQNIKPLNTFEFVAKRVIDYLGATVLAVLSLPVMIYAKYRIKKESPEGDYFFRQARVGLRGKEFDCVKFRSMRCDAEKYGAKFATCNDPRVFGWGKTMRKTRIDELPQLINVFRGDMHLIGPRPERKVFIDQFEKEIPYYNERHLVRPGITGWAQVNYPYGAGVEDARNKLMYDLYYIKYWSIWLDIKILFKTVLVVLGKRGL